MTERDLFREIGNINEKYVVEAEETKRSVILTPVFRRTLVTAACLFVCFGLYLGVRQLDLAPQNESAPMQLEMAADKAENAAMDSTSNSVTGAGEEGSFWDELWPVEGKATTDSASANTEANKESLSMGSAIQDVYEEMEGTIVEESVAQESLQESEKTVWVDLSEDLWLSGGQGVVDAFLEKSGNGEEATIELIKLLDDGTYEYAYLHYESGDAYVWTLWQAPGYGNNKEDSPKTVYGYLKVFEDTLEDGSSYCVIGLGETEDFTLQDIQSGAENTLMVLQYTK